MESFANDPFGLHAESLIAPQMMLRAVIIFFIALVLLRVAGVRTLGRQTSFDQLTVLILGSILGRAVVTGKDFFGNLVAVLVIVLLHRFISWLTYKSPKMGLLLKGKPLLLFANGSKQEKHMAREYITDEDIRLEMHVNVQSDKMEDISEVYLERSGELSFIKRN
jgi:uncharacterized membrane protein YcaP (DUF421 family)